MNQSVWFSLVKWSDAIFTGIFFEQVQEVGPYVYRQYRTKEVSQISTDKKSVIFRSIQKFIFDDTASAPLTENDDLVILNVQLNVSITLIVFLFSQQINDTI